MKTLIANRFYNTPLFLRQEKAAEIDAFLRQRVRGARSEVSDAQLSQWQSARGAAQGRAQRASGGAVAVIPVYGVLMPRADSLDEMSGATSLQSLQKAFRGALADAQVKTILLDVDSPGGSVAGVDELSSEIFAARGSKKIVAIADYQMASAAYYIASAASEVIASPSSDTGSIGVISLHLDLSKAAEMEGVKPTFITYGQYKAEGNQLEPLSDPARQFWQQRVNEYGDMFVKAVARNRGTTTRDVKDNFGQGRSFGAREAKARGLVDSIASFDDTVASLQKNGTTIAGGLRAERERLARLAG